MKTLSALVIITFFSVAAYAQVGQLDTSFSGDGKVSDWFPDGAYSGTITAMAIQPDGKILLACTTDLPGQFWVEWVIKRYTIDGSLDNGFGSGGAIVSGGETTAVVLSLKLQQDGKIIAVEANGAYYGTVRYNSNGTHDPSFNADSYFWNDFNEYSVALQSDGKIVVGGTVSLLDSGFILVRYISNGMLDTSFNSIGIVTTSIGIESGIHSVAIQPDGKILGAGIAATDTSTEFVLARYLSSGTLDTTFNLTGIVTAVLYTNPINFYGEKVSVALQEDGKIVGSYESYNQSDPFTMFRYNTDGTSDTTFGEAGRVIIDSSGRASFVIQPDGKIVIASSSWQEENADFILTRFNSDGSVDSSFGSNGTTLTDFDDFDHNYEDDEPNAVALDPNGKIVVAGNSRDRIAIARYISGLNVGILDFSSMQSSLFIYPNPIQQTEALEYTLTQNEILTLALYDINGNLVQSFFTNQQRTAGTHKETLNIGVLPAGNYLLTLSNDKQKMTMKVVKQ